MIHKTKCIYCHVELSDWGVKKDTLYISVYRYLLREKIGGSGILAAQSGPEQKGMYVIDPQRFMS